VPPELGIGGGTSPFGKTKPLPSQVHGDARGPRHAHLDGFDLHANVWVGPADRARLEQLCRYVLRPPLAENRLRRLADGRVRLELKRAWRDGTTHLLFEPLEFLEKLVALTPRPEINLVLYHGVLAPHARWRPDVVAHGRADGGRALDSSAAVAEAGRARTGSSRHWTWALLMRRAFDLDVLRCPRCAGRTQLIATIEDPAVIRQSRTSALRLPSGHVENTRPLRRGSGLTGPTLSGRIGAR